MLVLSRKRGEVILIGDDVTVTILEMRGNRVKLGITARGDVPIRREEAHPSIQGGAPALTHA